MKFGKVFGKSETPYDVARKLSPTLRTWRTGHQEFDAILAAGVDVDAFPVTKEGREALEDAFKGHLSKMSEATLGEISALAFIVCLRPHGYKIEGGVDLRNRAFIALNRALQHEGRAQISPEVAAAICPDLDGLLSTSLVPLILDAIERSFRGEVRRILEPGLSALFVSAPKSASSSIVERQDRIARLLGRDPADGSGRSMIASQLAKPNAAWSALETELHPALGEIAAEMQRRQADGQGDGHRDAIVSEVFDQLSARDRAQAIVDYYRVLDFVSADLWKSVAYIFHAGMRPAAPSLLSSHGVTKRVIEQRRRKCEHTSETAEVLLRRALDTRDHGFVLSAPESKSLARALPQGRADLIEAVTKGPIAKREKEILLAALEPEAAAARIAEKALGPTDLQVEKAALIEKIGTEPVRCFSLPAGDAGGSANWPELRDPTLFLRRQVNAWITAMEAAVVSGESIQQDLRELQAFLKKGLDVNSRIAAGEGLSEKPVAAGDNYREHGPKWSFLLSQGQIDGGFAPDDLRSHVVMEDILLLKNWLSKAIRLKAIQENFDHPVMKLIAGATKAKSPTKAFLTKVEEALDAEGRATVRKVIEGYRPPVMDGCIPRPTPEGRLAGPAVWAASLCPGEEIAPALLELLKVARGRNSDGQANDEKLGNQVYWALARMPQGSGIPYLVRTRAMTRLPKHRKLIDGALADAAKAAGLTRDDLEDMSVTDFGIHPKGVQKSVASGHAHLAIEDLKVTLSWCSAAGRTSKSPPKELATLDPDGVKAAKSLKKEIEQDLTAQARRLEATYLSGRSWPSDSWIERVRDHGTMGAIASCLIWEARWSDRRVSFLPSGRDMCDSLGVPVDVDGAEISLWHPIEASDEEVASWRKHLMDVGLRQPFRQAWRETYRVTDAERDTATYSNRFAGHILRQSKMVVVAQSSGWSVRQRVAEDRENDPAMRLLLPEVGLEAQYWNEAAGDEGDGIAYAYKYISTDRICFVRAGAKSGKPVEPLPVEDIGPRIFSEVMRHADLFVSVSSIALDPEWVDRGADARNPSNWEDVAARYVKRQATGELGVRDGMRRTLLEAVIPRLKAAGRISLSDRFLEVEGRLNTYQIHLGSGAVFIKDTRRHICIVPASTRAVDRVHLPFEGDLVFSLILSKALLLADDDKTTDKVILAQISGAR